MKLSHYATSLMTQNQIGKNNLKLGKSMEKLSTGQRINRAADDAVGLTISEKMRAQIRGLEQADRNCNDGISMLQTADGAMAEQTAILHRLKELTVQAGNGTYNEDDLAAIQVEISALLEEVDNISKGTNFNQISVLDGSGTINIQVGANEGEVLEINMTPSNTDYLGLTNSVVLQSQQNTTSLTNGVYDIIEDSENTGRYIVVDFNGNQMGVVTQIDPGKIQVDGETIELANKLNLPGDQLQIKNDQVQHVNKSNSSNGFDLPPGDYTIEKEPDGTVNLYLSPDQLIGEVNANNSEVEITPLLDLKNLGFKTPIIVNPTLKFEVNGIDLSSPESTGMSSSTIDKALKQLTMQRTYAGANINRLESKMNVITSTSEQYIATESRYRDVDMAKEVAEMTRLNVLQQSSQAMLSQGNQMWKNVLQLIQE